MEQPGQVLLCKAAQRQWGRAAGGLWGSDLGTRIWMTPGPRGGGRDTGAGTSLPHSCKRSSEETNSPLGFDVCGREGEVSLPPAYLPKGLGAGTL